MDADRPIARKEDDKLGFAKVADHLARALVDQSPNDGVVFGIEGQWGSGKSTLIKLTIAALEHHGDAAPEVIFFSPWVIGDRDTLLRSLFDELATAAARIDPIDSAVPDGRALPRWQRIVRWVMGDAHWRLRQKERLRQKLAGGLKAFGAVAGGVGKFANVAGAAGIPSAHFVGNVMVRGSDAIMSAASGASLSKQKTKLVEALKLISRHIVVFVDDLDRLEPREASEMLRLIRAVADFPNVLYVLSYDRDVIAKTLENAVQVDDGSAFLEKIVQVSFRVPRPEAFDLRRWFGDEVKLLFGDELGAARETEPPSRQALARFIDVYGGRYLETPRDVIRALNALRLHAIPVKNDIDIQDMVWLQLVRLGNPALYEWVEEYLTEVAAIANLASVPDAEIKRSSDRLSEILEADGHP